MPKTYDPLLLVLSALIAVWASYDALLLGHRARVAGTTSRGVWVIAGALAMGIGIWSMHFVGMLALRLPVPVYYDVTLVVLSVLIAVASAAVAFAVVTRDTIGRRHFWAGGLAIGVAISGMHYTAMVAMDIPAHVHHDPLLVAVSIAIACAPPVAALGLAFRSTSAPAARTYIWPKLGPAVLIGLTIAAMHYTAMAAVSFTAAPDRLGGFWGPIVPATPELALVVAMGTAAMLGMAQLGVVISKREDSVRQAEQRYRLLVDGVQEYAITTLDVDGRIASFNAGAERLSGYRADEVLGRHVSRFLEEPDLQPGMSRQQMKAAETRGWVKEEGLRVRKDGSRFWVDVLMTAIRDAAGTLVGFAAIGRDITERKQIDIELAQYRSQLRALASRIEAAREEERTRISREIHDRIGQALTALQLDLSWVETSLHDPAALKPKIQHMTLILRETLEALQRLASELRPPVLDKLGLRSAVMGLARDFESQTRIRSRVEVTAEEGKLDGDLATAAYRILQEALTNVARHAAATKVDIGFRLTPATLELEVRDNGRGINPEAQADHRSLGLLGMQERAQSWGGNVVIEGIPNEGTRVKVTIPLGQSMKEEVGV